MEQTMSKLQTRQFFAVAGQAFLIHDYILTFPLEMDYIWSAPWHAVKVIFLLNRYGNLIGQSVFTLEELGILSRGSAEFCSHFLWFISFFGLLSSESIHILVLLRAWAIWGCKRYVAIAMISAYVLYLAACVGMVIYIIVITTNHLTDLPPMHLVENGVCASLGGLAGSEWMMPLVSVSLDCVLFVMIATAIGKVYKQTQGFQRSPVLRVLAMDVALFFVTNAITGTVSMMCSTLFVHDPWSILMVALFPLLTVTGQRVVLNLRRLPSRPQTDQVVSRTVDRQISVIPRSALRQSVEHWTASQPQTVQRNQEFGDVSDTGSALEMKAMA